MLGRRLGLKKRVQGGSWSGWRWRLPPSELAFTNVYLIRQSPRQTFWRAASSCTP